MRTLALLCLLGGLMGCAERTPQARAQLTVRVSDDALQPLAEVPVEVDGSEMAKTDEHGTSRLTLPLEGSKLRIHARCPEAYRDAASRVVHVSTGAAFELKLVCKPKLRTLALVVSAPGGEGLTMRADGEPIGRIASDGTLHAVLKRAPASELRLALDTGPAPQLRPQHPSQDLTVPDRDEVILFNHPLAAPEARSSAPARERVKPRVAVRAPATANHVPYPIGKRW